MLEKLFKKEKLNYRNIIFLAIYTIVSFFIYVYFEVTKNPQNNILTFYTFFTHFSLIIFDYRALRKLNYFCFWMIIAVIHFVIYLNIIDNNSYTFVNGHAANGFKTTLILLVSFQIVRLFSFEVQGMDYVMPSKSGKMDIFDEREFTKWDIFFSMIMLGLMLFWNII